MTRLTLILAALLTACAQAPTVAQCEQRAEREGTYSGSAVENILKRDSLIRACLAGERA